MSRLPWALSVNNLKPWFLDSSCILVFSFLLSIVVTIYKKLSMNFIQRILQDENSEPFGLVRRQWPCPWLCLLQLTGHHQFGSVVLNILMRAKWSKEILRILQKTRDYSRPWTEFRSGKVTSHNTIEDIGLTFLTFQKLFKNFKRISWTRDS